MEPLLIIVLILLAAQVLAKLWLEQINCRHALSHAHSVPSAMKDTIDEATYRKSIDYTLAKSRLHQVEIVFSAVILAILLASGILPKWYELWIETFGESGAAKAGFMFALALASSLLGLPLDWHAQFHLEQRFGFNTTTPRLWWLDRIKGFGLSLLLGYPLLWLVLGLVNLAGSWWWLWAWAVILGFQLLLTVLAPVLILPLFNKFTPLPEGTLRERLVRLANRTDFKARAIQVMDGSKRSRHSNAFFMGFGKFRKIVLFDTLVEQLEEGELEAVLAHEIGHYRRKHIPRMLAFSAVTLLLGLYLVAWLSTQPWFVAAFGFQKPDTAIALLLFGLVGGVLTFWFSPLLHWWSRRYEYQADAFAAQHSEARDMIGALRKLSSKNLSNLNPHPIYSGFYYSHPTLVEREAALQRPAAKEAIHRA